MNRTEDGMRLSLIFVTFAIVAPLALAAAGPAAPAAHWKLDGDAAPAGTLLGRGQFVDSIIGGGGKALWCEGVDTAVRADDGVPALDGPFTISLWVCPLEARAGGILGGGRGKGAWALELTKAGALRFTGSLGAQTPDDRFGIGQWYHVALAGTGGGESTLYVNGQPAGTFQTPVGPRGGRLWIGRGGDEASPGFVGLIDDVRVYDAALPADGVAALTDDGLPWLRARPAWRDGFAGGKFALADHDVVAFVGGEDAFAAQRAGYLETLLTLGTGAAGVKFRDMAWEGDTVFEQWRVLNFGPWPRQLERVGAGVIVVQFGQTESLRGPGALADYRAAYEALLDEFAKRTKRIVVVSPTPFEDAGPLLPPAKGRNAALATYVDATRELAGGRGLVFVDLFAALGGGGDGPRAGRLNRALTRDGMHLSAYGQALAARELARRLGGKADEALTDDAEPKYLASAPEELRQAIAAKNELWLRSWRPPNWAFLAGDRVSQPSSRDHVDQRVRWMPAQWQQYPVLIDSAERKIAASAKGIKE